MEKMSKNKIITKKKNAKVIRPLQKTNFKTYHTRRTSFKMEEDDRYFKQGKLKDITCKDCMIILIPVNKNPVPLCIDTSCKIGLCYN